MAQKPAAVPLRLPWIRKRLNPPRQPLARWATCTVVSLALHVLLLYLLAPWWVNAFEWHCDLPSPPQSNPVLDHQPQVVAFQSPNPNLDEEPLVELQSAPELSAPAGTAPEPAAIESTATIPHAPEIDAPWAGRIELPDATPSIPEPTNAETGPLIAPTHLPVGGGFEGRTADARGKLVSERGGTPQSEAAVNVGLAWIVAHQHADGSWRFSHDGGPCAGRCRNSGSESSTTAATALALLPLLGAGHTPLDGDYAPAVARGLGYLQSRMVLTQHGGDFQEGTMYGQGLAAIALCEAYALSNDESLKLPAQQAINFIVHTQHFRGGWRYFPGQPGDTTVLGWQWMALKSGQLAGLSVSRETLLRAGEFLDTVQSDGGSAYGYQGPEVERSPTAVGLLCRMYSGWRRNDPRLARGVERLAVWGPSYDDMYFNYYATQVLHHQEGPDWPAWNQRLREHLIATQSKSSHETGSWHFADSHTTPGGRLCDTALALMILEVYYRHLPLYGMKAVDF